MEEVRWNTHFLTDMHEIKSFVHSYSNVVVTIVKL